ncbi:hypothetical protein F4824DRAFT_466657 [Ustulina deusta]|nr:hypothetical protein F4824DRAFT_466657 [Ustulina deusta]
MTFLLLSCYRFWPFLCLTPPSCIDRFVLTPPQLHFPRCEKLRLRCIHLWGHDKTKGAMVLSTMYGKRMACENFLQKHSDS